MEINPVNIDDKDTVFHYTNMRVAIEHILFQRQLRFSKSVKTNDPREYNDWVFSAAGQSSHSNNNILSPEKYVEANFKINQIIKSDYKLACFCSNKIPNPSDGNYVSTIQHGYDRLRMWSQYGEAFYGICIAFSASSLKQQLREQLGGSTSIYANHVDYDQDLRVTDRNLKWLNGNDLMGKDVDKVANAYVEKEENIKGIFFTKHIDYSGENEYRIIVHDPDNSFEYLDISKCFKAVLLGDRFPVVYKKMIKNFCDELNIEGKEVKWRYGKLSLTNIDYR